MTNGQACLCGFEEYADPSSPPRFYRTQTISGAADVCTYQFSSCAFPFNEALYTYTGTYTYDKDDCSETNTQNQALTQNNPGDGCGGSLGSPANTAPGRNFAPTNINTSGTRVLTSTPTNNEWEYVPDPVSPCTAAGKFTGTVNADLSDEDTEEDAENRNGGDWVPCSSCDSTCSAFKTERDETGKCFDYRQVQTRVNFGAEIGRSYTVTVTFARRVLGSGGPFLTFGNTELTVTADDVSEHSEWLDVPNEAGFETVPVTCLVVIIA